MLLIEPPVAEERWSDVRVRRSETLQRFCQEYEFAVMDQPWPRIESILRYLTRGLDGRRMTAELLHFIVDREVNDRDFEFSGRVARLVVLNSFARSLEDEGVELLPETEELLQRVHRHLPVLLVRAVDDHYGMLQN